MKKINFLLVLIFALPSLVKAQVAQSKDNKDSLVSTTKKMDTLIIQTRKPIIENKLDRTTVNVSSLLNNAGSSVLDALTNAPGIDVDINGNISLKGKSGVSIYIDGRQSPLSTSDLAAYLRSIPASQVDQIEIMSQPSSRFDAAGTSGVINIIMKKNKLMGFSGNLSLSYTQGVYTKTSNSFNFNYKNHNWNFYVNVSQDLFHSFTKRHLVRLYPGQSKYPILLQDNEDIPIIPGYSMASGIDVNLSKQVLLSIAVNRKESNYKDVFTSTSTVEATTNSPLSTIEAANNIFRKWINESAIVSSLINLNAQSHLEVTTNYEYFHFDAGQQSTNITYDSTGQLESSLSPNPYIQQASLPSTIKIYTLKADYTNQLSKTTSIEGGIKLARIQSANNSLFFIRQGDSLYADPNFTNFFNYKETINAIYTNYKTQIKTWELQAGLRFEQTSLNGDQKIGNVQTHKNYLQLFPGIFIGYHPTQFHNLSISYGRRIDRPDYQDLNPFIYVLDPYTYRKGNPDLQPYFTNNFEINYNYKGKLNVSANYTRSTNVINDIIYQNDTSKILTQTRKNLSVYTNWGFSINYHKEISKSFLIIASYDLFNNQYKGNIYLSFIDQQVTTHQFNLLQQFHFNKGWSGELLLYYRTSLLFPALYVRGPRNMNSFAVGKDILKSKGNLKLRITDPFYLQKSYVSNNIGAFQSIMNFKEDSRRIGLTFSYHFQKGDNTASRKLYIPEERNRVNIN